MPGIIVRTNESLDNALRRFKKQVGIAGIIAESKKRRFYEKPSIKKRRKAAEAKKRRLRMKRFRRNRF